MTLFPPRLRRMMEAVAASTRAPVELAAICALGASSACAVGRVKLRINPDWCESGQLFLLGVAPSGSFKSTVRALMIDPLTEIFDQQHKEAAARNQRLFHERDTLEVQLAQAKKKGDRDKVSALVDELNALPPINEGRRYTSGDSTPEALLDLMHRNGGRIAQFDDEGTSLDVVTDTSAKLPNLSPWLDGYTGSHTIHVERRGGSYIVEKAALSVMVLTQPLVLDAVLDSTRAVGKGYLARFLIVKTLREDDLEDAEPIPPEVRKDYEDDLLRMSGLGEMTLTLTPEAAKLYRSWVARCRQERKTAWHTLSDLGFRLEAMPARLAVNLALWQGTVFQIDAELLARAIRLGEWFIAHLLALFGDEITMSRAAEIMLDVIRGKLKSGKEPPFSARELKNARRQGLKDSRAQDEALAELCELGYLRPALTVDGRGRWYEVNPGVM